MGECRHSSHRINRKNTPKPAIGSVTITLPPQIAKNKPLTNIYKNRERIEKEVQHIQWLHVKVAHPARGRRRVTLSTSVL